MLMSPILHAKHMVLRFNGYHPISQSLQPHQIPLLAASQVREWKWRKAKPQRPHCQQEINSAGIHGRRSASPFTLQASVLSLESRDKGCKCQGALKWPGLAVGCVRDFVKSQPSQWSLPCIPRDKHHAIHCRKYSGNCESTPSQS